MAKGRKTGGHQKGTPNRATLERRSAVDALKLSGVDPFMVFCQVLASEDAPYKERSRAAELLLPYCRPKLSAVEHHSTGRSHEERLALMEAEQREWLKSALADEPPQPQKAVSPNHPATERPN